MPNLYNYYNKSYSYFITYLATTFSFIAIIICYLEKHSFWPIISVSFFLTIYLLKFGVHSFITKCYNIFQSRIIGRFLIFVNSLIYFITSSYSLITITSFIGDQYNIQLFIPIVLLMIMFLGSTIELHYQYWC